MKPLTGQWKSTMRHRIWAIIISALLVLAYAKAFMPIMKKVEAYGSDTTPIKWAIITLGGYNYYNRKVQFSTSQKVENYVYKHGVPYDEFPDDDMEAPTDTPSAGKYPLQHTNGTIRYQVIVLTQYGQMWSVANKSYILWAAGNGTNVVIFGWAARYIPELFGLTSGDITTTEQYPTSANATIFETFNDGLVEYEQDSTVIQDYSPVAKLTMFDPLPSNIKLWFNLTTSTPTTILGMFNKTYENGKVWWHYLAAADDHPFGVGGSSWLTMWIAPYNHSFPYHAMNFMFQQLERVNVGLRPYKKWAGAITYRLDEDSYIGIMKPNETAMQNGWAYDAVICALGYLTGGGTLTDGMPDGYTGAPSNTVKHGSFSGFILFDPYIETSRTFIIYNTTNGGNYTRMKVDYDEDQDFSDETEYQFFENQTDASVYGTYYWCGINNWTEPTSVAMSSWMPVSDRINQYYGDASWFRNWGEQGALTFGFHGWQHEDVKDEYFMGTAPVYNYWNGTHVIENQTWIEQKLTEAKNDLVRAFESTGYGFEADKASHSGPGNSGSNVVDTALKNLTFVYTTYGDGIYGRFPMWYLRDPYKPMLSCGGGEIDVSPKSKMDGLVDMVNTMIPIFGIYHHGGGFYNLSYSFEPYTNMFKWVHIGDSYEFWSNARYMKRNTVDAYADDSHIVLEYKANSTLEDYVWMFPLKYNGKYFNGFSDNRTVGKIKHIDGKYIYIEFSEGGNERLEATYGPNPHIYQTSCYIENITQIYTLKNLTLRLWNGSGTVDIKANCTRLGQPNSIKINGTSINFNYNPTTKICFFNVTFNTLKTVEVMWEYAPPNPPTSVSPKPASRLDPSKFLTFTWEFSDPDQGDSQFAYRFQLSDNYDFISPIIDTGKVTSPSTQTTQALPNTVALYYWRVKTWDNRDAEGEWSDAQPIIVDKLKAILKGVTDDRADVGTSVSVYFNVVREYDDAPFDGTEGIVYINGSTATWDEVNKYWKVTVTQNSVGEWKYQVSSITDTEHHITTINDLAGTQKIIWDRLIVTITPDTTTATVGLQIDFTVTAVYTYDNKRVPEFTVNILRDEAHFASNNFTDTSDIASTHQYTTENVVEKIYGLTAFASNSPSVTWTPKSFIQLLVDWITSNALIVIPVIQLFIVLSYLFIRECRKHRNT